MGLHGRRVGERAGGTGQVHGPRYLGGSRWACRGRWARYALRGVCEEWVGEQAAGQGWAPAARAVSLTGPETPRKRRRQGSDRRDPTAFSIRSFPFGTPVAAV